MCEYHGTKNCLSLKRTTSIHIYVYIYIYIYIYIIYIFSYIYKVFTYNVYNVSFKNKLLLKKVSTAVRKKFSSKIQMGY